VGIELSKLYKERLKTGGELVVEKTKWMVQYYFPGPDLRHNGEFYEVLGSNISDVVNAYKANYTKFSELKRSIPGGGEYKEGGLGKMTIRVNGHFEGVCVCGYKMPIKTQSQLNDLLADYAYCSQRALLIQEALLKLQDQRISGGRQ